MYLTHFIHVEGFPRGHLSIEDLVEVKSFHYSCPFNYALMALSCLNHQYIWAPSFKVQHTFLQLDKLAVLTKKPNEFSSFPCM